MTYCRRARHRGARRRAAGGASPRAHPTRQSYVARGGGFASDRTGKTVAELTHPKAVAYVAKHLGYAPEPGLPAFALPATAPGRLYSRKLAQPHLCIIED